MKYIVSLSGGLSSFEALRRTVEKHGTDNVVCLFADTKIEDEDLYRFLDDIERHFGVPIVRLADGRDVWDVLFEYRMFRVNTFAPCSRELKRNVIEGYIRKTFRKQAITRVYGLNWDEYGRRQQLVNLHEPAPVWFPLAEKPWLWTADFAKIATDLGIRPPRLYEMGFEHNNCGGFCVRAGQAHFATLLREMPDRYAYHEQREEELRQEVGKDIALLHVKRKSGTRSMTLRQFRLEQEHGRDYDRTEFGGCGCFVDE